MPMHERMGVAWGWGMRGTHPPGFDWLKRRKLKEVSPQVRSRFRPADSVMPPQDLVGIFPSSLFPESRNSPLLAATKLQGLLVLVERWTGPFVHCEMEGAWSDGLAWHTCGMCIPAEGMWSSQWPPSAPHAEDMGYERALPTLYQAGMYMLRDQCFNR